MQTTDAERSDAEKFRESVQSLNQRKAVPLFRGITPVSPGKEDATTIERARSDVCRAATETALHQSPPVVVPAAAAASPLRESALRAANEFSAFMRSRRTQKTGFFITHTMMSDANSVFPSGKFNLSDADREEFLNKYRIVVMEGIPVCVVERHSAAAPVLCDLDFRFTEPPRSGRVYGGGFVESFIARWYGVITKYVDVTQISDANKCYVTEKTAAVFDEARGVWKDGLHLMFPYIVTTPELQLLIRETLVKDMDDLVAPLNLSCTCEDLVDRAVIDVNGWMMYGSCKPGKEAYMVRNDASGACGMYEASVSVQGVRRPDDMSSEYHRGNGTRYHARTLVSLLSIRRTLAECSPMTNSGKSLFKNYMTLQESQRETAARAAMKSNDVALLKSPEDFRYACGLVDLLSEERAKSYDAWMKVGWCLFNIDCKLLEKWIEFSERAPEYASSAREECTRLWMSMEPRNMSIGSLVAWAREDSPNEFAEYRNRESLECKVIKCMEAIYPLARVVLDATSGKSKVETNGKPMLEEAYYHVALIMQHCYGDVFACSSYCHGQWFHFDSHAWRETDKGIPLRNKMVEEVSVLFEDFAARFELRASRKEAEGAPPGVAERFRLYKQGCLMLRNKMTALSARDTVMRNCSEVFYWKRPENHRPRHMPNCMQFEMILDSDMFLVGMLNGVYDLANHCFRNGRPHDYVRLCTGIEYREYSLDSPEILEIMEFMRQVIPKETVRVYVLQTLASFLDGHTGSELIHVWSGSGGNGKTKVIALFESSIGEYATTLPMTLLTGKRTGSSNATPELAKLLHKRFAPLNEPDQGDKFSIGLLKELTGGDKIYARRLHNDPIEFKPTHKMVVLCNSKPEVPPDDEAAWRRLRHVVFSSRFVENPDVTKVDAEGNREEFKRDNYLDLKLKKWAQPFFWLMTYYYRINKLGDAAYKWETVTDPATGQLKVGIERGIREPQDVIMATQDYRTENDPITRFVKRAVISYKPGATLYLHDLFEVYQFTIRKGNYGGLHCNIDSFRTQVSKPKRLGPADAENGEAWSNKELALSRLGECANGMPGVTLRGDVSI